MQFDKDMNSELAELFLDVRAFIIKEINKTGYDTKERYKENITSFFTDEFNNGYCYIKTKDDYVRLGWFRGSYMIDKFDFLTGNGKYLRGQNIKEFNTMQKNAVKFYIKETHNILLEHEAKKDLKKAMRD